MTVSSQTNKIRIVGNGVASAFPLPFRFFTNSEISALFVERATGVTTPAAIGTDYTLTGAGEPEVNGSATGVLTTTVPLAATRDLIILRTLPTIQATDIVNQGEFFASTHEDVFDRLTMIAQQQQEELSRAIKTSVSDTITPDQLLDSIRLSEQTAIAAAASASSSAASAAQSFDDFDDRYLGSKAADPTTDNDGQPLIVGALYWNTPLAKMKAWDGSAWAFWSGDISGPSSSTDTSIVVFNGINGKLVKESAAKVNDSGDVISNGAQFGQSGTASNNFHWRNMLDGLLRLSRGNAGSLGAGDNAADVMRVKADNSVEFPGGIRGGFAKEYTSAEQTITAGGTVNLTHGLGAVPKLIRTELVCKTAESDYVIGDVIEVDLAVTPASSLTSTGHVVKKNSTTISVTFGNSATAYFGKSSAGASVTLANANWRLIVRAWA